MEVFVLLAHLEAIEIKQFIVLAALRGLDVRRTHMDGLQMVVLE